MHPFDINCNRSSGAKAHIVFFMSNGRFVLLYNSGLGASDLHDR